MQECKRCNPNEFRIGNLWSSIESETLHTQMKPVKSQDYCYTCWFNFLNHRKTNLRCLAIIKHKNFQADEDDSGWVSILTCACCCTLETFPGSLYMRIWFFKVQVAVTTYYLMYHICVCIYEWIYVVYLCRCAHVWVGGIQGKTPSIHFFILSILPFCMYFSFIENRCLGLGI